MSLKVNNQLALTTVVGVCVGAAIIQTIHAQQTKPPPAYLIAEVVKDPSKPQDPEAARRYADEAPKSLFPFGGRYVVRGGTVQTLEGEPPKGYIVVIGFDSLEKARAWYDSPAYEAIKPIRQNTTKSRLLLVQGVIEP
jgi:uncharacterized protein (DUF1330 family)